MKTAYLIQRLREAGDRATPVRSALMGLLSTAPGPLSVADMGRILAIKGLQPNKTTLYRELDFMVGRGWVQELDLGRGRKCYEWAEGHHHHLVCRKCHRIEEVKTEGLEKAFGAFEKGLVEKSRFSQLSHSLEFYGICNQCVG